MYVTPGMYLQVRSVGKRVLKINVSNNLFCISQTV